MKTKNIFFVFIFIILMQSVKLQAWDTTAAKFYPLNVGNVYIYDHIDLWFNCDPFQLINRYRVVIDDLILMPNGKKYFKFSGWWQIGGQAPNWKYQRIDSNSMNVYSYDSINNSEFLLDSLQINSGNTFSCNRFNSHSPYGWCTGTNTYLLFGAQRIMKGFAASYFAIITSSYSIIEGIGFGGYSSCEVGSGSAYSLKGCILNGVVYGDTTLTSVSQIGNTVPQKFSLSQNYPNPFNPVTHLEFGISNLGFVSLKVYDALGEEVKILVNEIKPAGNYGVEFDGSDLPSGIYFYKLQSGDFVETKRMILLK